MITNENIVCLSTQDWDDVWTRKQRFMQRFAKQGNRVLYIEAQSSLVSLGILKKDWKRIFHWLKGPRKIDDNLYIVTLPLVLPFFQMFIFISKINNWFISIFLKYQLKKLNFRSFIFLTYAPFSDGLVKRLGEKFAIYDCVDEFSDSKGLVRTKVIKQLEEKVLKKVKFVIVTHKNLFESKKKWNKNIYLISNGADIDHFKKTCLPETAIASDMIKIPKPIIGFLGVIQYWIDLDLIRHLALSKPDWSIVLIGPVARLAEVKKIKNIPNIYLLGRKPYTVLPSYVKAFDVCINPYVLNETAENCSPLKLYDYLASGKPVVSVDMPEAREFEDFIEIGLNYENFVKKINKILEQLPENSEKINARMEAVKMHSWEHRFSDFEKTIESYLQNN